MAESKMAKKKRKTPQSEVGRKLRTYAAQYLASGQRERAEGLAQAADLVDQEASFGLVSIEAIMVHLEERILGRLEELAADLASAARIASGKEEPEVAPARAAKGAPPPPVGDLMVHHPTPAPGVAKARAPRGNGKPSAHGRGERKLLTAIVQHETLGGVTRAALTVMTGFKKSTRNTYLQRLGAAGLIEEQGDRLFPTADGRRAMPSVEPLPTGAALLALHLSELPRGERDVLEVLVRMFPHPLARERIDEPTGFKKSTRNTYLQRLESRGLVERVGPDVRASYLLFDRGREALPS